ncbi:unnamed protein product [Durusdinium trenchii]|uniref:Dynein heavy chain ATP-binding dynein motor region domain-containing protein n=1 Tax=Durusdinium trenchii TaxID=1381693 RepID=A0ABP0SRI4_9DINO
MAAEYTIVLQDCQAFPPVLLDLKPRPKKGAGLEEPSPVKEVTPTKLRRISRKMSTSRASLSTNSLKSAGQVESGRSFQLYMTSSLGSCQELSPVTMHTCSVVNFALNLEGFTEVLLDAMIRQVPELDQEFTHLFALVPDESSLRAAEEKLLSFLEDSHGASILEGQECPRILGLYAEARKQQEAATNKFQKELQDFHHGRRNLRQLGEPLALAVQSAWVRSAGWRMLLD